MTGHFVQGSQFYLTAPAPCPYLPHRRERKVFTHLSSGNACLLNDMLSRHGFRRSQAIAYRPACESCSACMSLRVDVAGFRHTSSMRRVRNANADLTTGWRPARATSEQYSLFRRYLDDRHLDGGMSGMTVLDYAMMVEDSHVHTEMVEYRRRSTTGGKPAEGNEDNLVAVALTDRLEDGLSLVYSFFDPDLPKRSFGTFVILDHIERARAAGLPYVYLGYWVEGSRKMDYKVRFRPHERLTPKGWERFE